LKQITIVGKGLNEISSQDFQQSKIMNKQKIHFSLSIVLAVQHNQSLIHKHNTQNGPLHSS